MLRYVVCFCLPLLSGCATILGGTSQNVSVETSPPGASCTADRQGSPVASVTATPGLMRVGKNGSDLSVTCTKPGYQAARATAPSSFNGLTFVNLALGGLVGVVVDASSGANFDYPSQVTMQLQPDPSAPPMLVSETDKRSRAQEARVVLVNRTMDLPEISPARRAFLLGACSAGDETACILSEVNRRQVRATQTGPS